MLASASACPRSMDPISVPSGRGDVRQLKEQELNLTLFLDVTSSAEAEYTRMQKKKKRSL